MSLLSACEQGNFALAEKLVTAGADVNGTDDEETSPIIIAASNGDENIVRLLLMHGASVDKPNVMGWTPLLMSCLHGHVGITSYLIQNGADVHAQNNYCACALLLAARGGHLSIVRLLLDAGLDVGPSTTVSTSMCEFTPLMTAAFYGHDAVVRLLSERGADVNYRTPSTGINALMLAALNGHMSTVQILIERGADANLTNVNNCTPLDFADKRREVKGYLDRKTVNKKKLSAEESKQDIIEATKKGDISRVREILDADPKQKDASSSQDGATPLMFAAMIGRLDIAQLLVDKGCEIDKQDLISGWTALMQAIYHGKKVVAKYLLSVGADVLIPAKNGCTSFDLASLIDDVDVELYRLLASKAVQINKKSIIKTSSQISPVVNENGYDVVDGQKNGLKSWLGRMSNRFRNLKLGNTMRRKFSHKIEQEVAPRVGPSLLGFSENNENSTNLQPCYESFLSDTRKSLAKYTLGLNVATEASDGTLKAVIPPFLPPPTFETDRSNSLPKNSSCQQWALNNRNSSASVGESQMIDQSSIRTVKYQRNFVMPPENKISTPNSTHIKVMAIVPENGGSPSSSNSAATMSSVNRPQVASSATSSTLTAGSANKTFLHRMQVPIEPERKSMDLMSFYRNTADDVVSKYSLNSDKLSNKKPGRATSASSKETQSTLTPFSSQIAKSNIDSKISTITKTTDSAFKESDESSVGPKTSDLGVILKQLSLEKYQPIFEEQEVDMEAFLTLTDLDLKELGIEYAESRKQIMAAITELNTKKL